MVNRGVNLGLSGVIAQPMTLCIQRDQGSLAVYLVYKTQCSMGWSQRTLTAVGGTLVSWKAVWVF